MLAEILEYYKKLSKLYGCGLLNHVFTEMTYLEVFKQYYMYKLQEPDNSKKPTVISVGSGEGYHEKFMEEFLDVKCYDKDISGCQASNKTSAHFPEDNEKILSTDCKDIILFSAYPQGYLGGLLEIYRKRGGNKLCVVVAGSIKDWIHTGYEPDQGTKLFSNIDNLIKEGGYVARPIGGCIPELQSSPTLIVFYGNWDVALLQQLHNQACKRIIEDKEIRKTIIQPTVGNIPGTSQEFIKAPNQFYYRDDDFKKTTALKLKIDTEEEHSAEHVEGMELDYAYASQDKEVILGRGAQGPGIS